MSKVFFELESERYELEDMEAKFLFSYMLRYQKKYNKNVLEEEKVRLSDRELSEFRIYIDQALNELITDGYTEPPIKKRQKHPTLFEKFVFEGKKYIVDYTTSEIGRLIYTLYLRLSFIDKAIHLQKDLFIVNSKG